MRHFSLSETSIQPRTRPHSAARQGSRRIPRARAAAARPGVVARTTYLSKIFQNPQDHFDEILNLSSESEFEFGAVQRFANLVDLVKRFPTNIYLQKSASIQLKTSPDKFAVQVGLVWVRWARFHPCAGGTSSHRVVPGHILHLRANNR